MGIQHEDRLEKIAQCADAIGRVARSVAKDIAGDVAFEKEFFDLMDRFQINVLGSQSTATWCQCPYQCCSTRIVGPYNEEA